MKNWDTLDADINLILNKHYTPGRAGARINKIILHHNAGNLTAQTIYRVWQDRPASAHYQVDRNGIISQHVWDSDTAWHAGNWAANRTSIGIEHANSIGTTGPVTAKTLEEGAHLVAALCKYYGLGRPTWGVNVFGHKQFSATSCPGHLMGSQHATYMARAQAWYDAMTSGGNPPAPADSGVSPSASIDQLARDVIAGKYGTGQERKTRLGARYSEVQNRVNQILAGNSTSTGRGVPSVSQLADAVLRGEYGNGSERRNRLGARYNEVQEEVNRRLGTRPAYAANIDALARDVIAGKYGTGTERKTRLGANYTAVQARVNQILLSR